MSVVYVAHPWDEIAARVARDAQTAEQAHRDLVASKREELVWCQSRIDDWHSDINDEENRMDEIRAELRALGETADDE